MTGPALTDRQALPVPGSSSTASDGPRGSLLARALILPIRGYQLFISPALPPTCRYYPSCSAYAVEALRVHGAIKGTWLAIRRIARCHPWHWSGYDPVPPRGVRRTGAERRALALLVAAGAESSADQPAGDLADGGADTVASSTAETAVGSVGGSVAGSATGAPERASTADGPSSPSATTPVRTRRAVAQPPSRSASAAATTAGSSAA